MTDQIPPLHAFEKMLRIAWPPHRWCEGRVLLAVSGGADSVALLRTMHTQSTPLGGYLIVGHFNHHLRGHDADADQQFVIEQCQALSLDFEIGHGSPSVSRGDGESLEAAARAARYAFLQQTAEQRGARYVATAHTADDQAETVLHHILRGTGLAGLAGMSRTRPLGPAVTLIRPMLEISREQVLAYLTDLAQPYREDSTNAELQFTRNRIRHELLPLLRRDYSPGIVNSLLRLAGLAADSQRVIDGIAQPLVDRWVVAHDAHRVTIDCSAMDSLDLHLVREVLVIAWRRQGWPLQSMGFEQWNSLAEMASAQPSKSESGCCKQVFPGAITAEKQGKRLLLCASPDFSTPHTSASG